MDWRRTEVFHGNEELVGRDVLLLYPNFIEEFIIRTDASKTQIRGVIGQNGKSISLHSQKINSTQIIVTKCKD